MPRRLMLAVFFYGGSVQRFNEAAASNAAEMGSRPAPRRCLWGFNEAAASNAAEIEGFWGFGVIRRFGLQ